MRYSFNKKLAVIVASLATNLYILLSFISLFLFTSCDSRPAVEKYVLTQSEKQICDTLQVDTNLIHQIRLYNSSSIEPFHYSPTTITDKFGEREMDPIFYPGLRFTENHLKSDELILKLKNDFKTKGYTIFLLKNNSDINNEPDHIGVLKTTDKYVVLKHINTNGLNWNITNDSVIKIIKEFDNKYKLELISASSDGCEFIINNEPQDWTEIAEELNKSCPDYVEQGWATIEEIAAEMKKSKRIPFWWD